MLNLFHEYFWYYFNCYHLNVCHHYHSSSSYPYQQYFHVRSQLQQYHYHHYPHQYHYYHNILILTWTTISYGISIPYISTFTNITINTNNIAIINRTCLNNIIFIVIIIIFITIIINMYLLLLYSNDELHDVYQL